MTSISRLHSVLHAVWLRENLAAPLLMAAGLMGCVGCGAGAGTATPGAGPSPNSGYGLDANLVLPFAIAPDATGNIWVTNFDNATVTMFFGLATSTSTPSLPSPIAHRPLATPESTALPQLRIAGKVGKTSHGIRLPHQGPDPEHIDFQFILFKARGIQ